jgi:hypothetical protein
MGCAGHTFSVFTNSAVCQYIGLSAEWLRIYLASRGGGDDVGGDERGSHAPEERCHEARVSVRYVLTPEAQAHVDEIGAYIAQRSVDAALSPRK